MRKIKVALVGTPNVGKSTIYNTLTKNHEHTGNWAGKTVELTKGECEYQNVKYVFYDLPGTYSLISKSDEEVVATDFICFQDFDVAVVVCDATSLDKGMNLVLQTREICKNVVVCVNLMDEAKKKGIRIDFLKLEERLGIPVIKTSARANEGLEDLLLAIKTSCKKDYLCIDYGILNKEIKQVSLDIDDSSFNKNWIALKILENNLYYIKKFEERGILHLSNNTKEAKEHLENVDVNLEIVIRLSKKAKEILMGVVSYQTDYSISKERKIDKILTSKIWGIPIMLLMLFIIFYITIIGANYPSNLLFCFFSYLESYFVSFLKWMMLPSGLISFLIDGVYKTLYWVISVMLPPMLIFFPIFTFLEDLGLLPRIAFNMDRAFQKCNACGKQALTMCMGIGCNAVGVTGTRIIDSKRERLIAILTNVFVPCNGKFPTLIAVITMFFVGLNKSYGNLFCALILTGFIALGVFFTFLISFLLSKSILKGVPPSFTLELPPYRIPKIWDTIKYSVKNRAIFVLQRAIKVAIPAGAIIWCVANIKINQLPILTYLINFFEPFGVLLGLDGVVILAMLLGFPANEIVIPIMLMCYLKTGALTDYSSLTKLREILVMNGWTIKTALCFLALMMFHFPCSTTLLTIKKETGSVFYTILSFFIPLVVGIFLCLIIHFLF